jgi:DNA-binding FadR family transcriptional regulator
VTDYLTEGSLDLLLHLMKHSETVDSDVVLALMEFRKMSEMFALGKAVGNAGESDINALSDLVERETRARSNYKEIADCDYSLHLTIMKLSGNLILQLLFNSFKPVYRFYANFFFRLPGAIQTTVSQHKRLIRAISERDTASAAAVMEEMLSYGERKVAEALGIVEDKKGISMNATPEKAAGSRG